MGAVESPVPYGKRLVPIIVDETAKANPGKVFASIPRTGDLKDGFVNVSFGDFARAINRTARWMEDVLGLCTTFETLAYIGTSDLRYYILMVAAAKVGYKVRMVDILFGSRLFF